MSEVAQQDESTTWRDPASGLTWQVRGAYVERDLAGAHAYCADLEIDGDADWRVPTIDDLRTLLRGCPDTMAGGACRETNACPGVGSDCYDDLCMGCIDGRGPGVNGCFWPTEMGPDCEWTWASSLSDNPPHYACFAHFRNAHLSHNPVGDSEGHHVVCVR